MLKYENDLVFMYVSVLIFKIVRYYFQNINMKNYNLSDRNK